MVKKFLFYSLLILITATLAGCKLSGRITKSTGEPFEGVTVVLSGDAQATETTDSNGEYEFEGPGNSASYTITPSLNNYTFDPEQWSGTPTADVEGIDFVGIFPEFELSGRVTTSNAEPLQNVTIALSGGVDATTTTDSNGEYVFVVPNKNAGYTLTPSIEGYTFDPVQLNVEINESTLKEDIGGLNFKAVKNIHTSGRVTTSNGTPFEGATIPLYGGNIYTKTTTTNSNGEYDFEIPGGFASYYIKPIVEDYFFSPERVPVVINQYTPPGDIEGIDFTARKILTWGGLHSDEGRSIQQTTDGGYIIAGIKDYKGSGASDGWLIKTDVNGNEEWNKTYGEANSSFVQQTTDGGYILAGGIGLGSGLIKTDANGNEEWNKTYGKDESDMCNSAQQTADGGYILTGRAADGLGNFGFWLVKTDANGNEEWNNNWAGIFYSQANSVQQTTDGGYIMAGYIYPRNGGCHFMLRKTDANGNQEWNRTFGDGSFSYAHSVQQTTEGGYIVAGNKEFDHFWLIKTDANGNEEWNKTYGDSGGYSVQQTTDGGYIVAGGEYDAELIKTDADGNEEWNMVFGGKYKDCAKSVQQTTDGGYIIAGFTESFGAGAVNPDVWLVIIDANENNTSLP